MIITKFNRIYADQIWRVIGSDAKHDVEIREQLYAEYLGLTDEEQDVQEAPFGLWPWWA